MAMAKFEVEDPDESKRLRNAMGPHNVDHYIRSAIQICWMALPHNKQNVDEVEKQIRRIVDRAIKDLREDSQQFGR